MTKAPAPSWWESAAAALRGKPGTNIPVVRSVKATPAHSILLGRNMIFPWGQALTKCHSIRTQPVADCSLNEDDRCGRANCVCVWVGPVSRGKEGRLVWQANCSFETHIFSLTCSYNTVQNGSCRDTSDPINSWSVVFGYFYAGIASFIAQTLNSQRRMVHLCPQNLS
jgi:hypothetical protein